MSYEFRMPNLSAGTPEGKLRQVESFLRQHVEQLNWVLQSLEAGAASGLTEEQLAEAARAVSQSAEVFGAFCRKLRKKQAQENFLGAGKRTICEGGSWAQGAAVTADTAAVERYTLFSAVSGGVPVLCVRHGGNLYGDGIRIACGDGTLTLTEAENPVTALYGVI